MRTLSVILILVIAGSVVACSKLYFDDQPTNGKLTGPDASTYPPGDGGLPDNDALDADNGCGSNDAGGPSTDGGCCPSDGGPNWPADAGNYPLDAPGNWPPADAP